MDLYKMLDLYLSKSVNLYTAVSSSSYKLIFLIYQPSDVEFFLNTGERSMLFISLYFNW